MAPPKKQQRTIARLHALSRRMEELASRLTSKDVVTVEEAQAAMQAAGLALRALKMADERQRKKRSRW